MNWSDFVYYDESSPTCLRRTCDKYHPRTKQLLYAKDSVAGFESQIGYYVVCINNKLYYAHRIIWELLNSEIIPAGNEVDHINRDKLCNKIENLRLVTRKINSQNHGVRTDNTSGITGVYLTRNKNCTYWSANASVNGKIIKKHFSIEKLGNDEAFRLAKECRENMIALLNDDGNNYTVNHGK